jgi:hypothetical protein
MKRFHGNRTLAMLLFSLIGVEMLSSAPAISNFTARSLVAANRKGSSLLPRLDLTGDRASVRGVVKVAMEIRRTFRSKKGRQIANTASWQKI